jgi:heat-inducible transcriptional repressor
VRPGGGARLPIELSERQAAVLRAVVAGYVGEVAPVGSKTVARLLPVSLSAASVRSVLAELAELGLLEKPHASAGRIPTERGLRLFVASLLPRTELGPLARREIAWRLDTSPADEMVHVASELLSQHARLLGFVVTPRLDRLVLRHVSLVRLSAERLLVVLVAETGTAHRRIVETPEPLAQAELDRITAVLSERVEGRTLPEVRDLLAREAEALRHQANRLLELAISLGQRALAADHDAAVDLVIETRLALLEQPEFRDPRRIRDLFEAVETKARLLEVLDRVLEDEGVSVALGAELEDPSLRHCALVAAHYGKAGGARGALGVIGPSRMDYPRIVALVNYLSAAVGERLAAFAEGSAT